MFAGFFVAENVEANEGLTLTGVKFAVIEEEEVEDESVSEEEEELVADRGDGGNLLVVTYADASSSA